MARMKTSGKGEEPGGFMAMPLPGAAVAGLQMAQFWKAQERIVSETEAFARHWFARRHEAAKSALEACEQAAAANPLDASGALEAFREWQAHSAERMAADLREWVDLWARCAGHLVRGEIGASAETLEELQSEASELHSPHATPV